MLSQEKVKELLKDRNLKVIAVEADISYYALCYWLREDSTKPSFRMISQLSDYLEKTARQTIGE